MTKGKIVPGPDEQPPAAARTWLLSGVPRSGTSLCCRLAGDLPDVVALSEPIRYREYGGMEDPERAAARIRDFAEEARERIRSEGCAPSVQFEGRLDDNRTTSHLTEAGLRRLRGGWGEMAVAKPLTGGFGLLIKHNALFAALLPRLIESFACLALVRNPLPVLASWQTVAFPVHRGRVPAGEAFDPGLRQRLDAEPDVLRRQLIVLDWFFDRFEASLRPEAIIRYEDLVASGGLALFRRLGHPGAAPVTLESGNASRVYGGVNADGLLASLLEADGAWTRFYPSRDLEAAAERIRRGPPAPG